MLAHLDLLPQREIGRHVQRATPYDGHQGGSAPYELSRSHQDWESSLSFLLFEPPYMMAATRAFLTCPGPLIPVPDSDPSSIDNGPTSLISPTPSSKSAAENGHPSLTQIRR